jgi:hypothetical protein
LDLNRKKKWTPLVTTLLDELTLTKRLRLESPPDCVLAPWKAARASCSLFVRKRRFLPLDYEFIEYFSAD